MSMIRNGEMWLRNTQCMNDFSEVRHGLELLGAGLSQQRTASG